MNRRRRSHWRSSIHNRLRNSCHSRCSNWNHSRLGRSSHSRRSPSRTRRYNQRCSLDRNSTRSLDSSSSHSRTIPSHSTRDGSAGRLQHRSAWPPRLPQPRRPTPRSYVTMSYSSYRFSYRLNTKPIRLTLLQHANCPSKCHKTVSRLGRKRYRNQDSLVSSGLYAVRQVRIGTRPAGRLRRCRQPDHPLAGRTKDSRVYSDTFEAREIRGFGGRLLGPAVPCDEPGK